MELNMENLVTVFEKCQYTAEERDTFEKYPTGDPIPPETCVKGHGYFYHIGLHPERIKDVSARRQVAEWVSQMPDELFAEKGADPSYGMKLKNGTMWTMSAKDCDVLYALSNAMGFGKILETPAEPRKFGNESANQIAELLRVIAGAPSAYRFDRAEVEKCIGIIDLKAENIPKPTHEMPMTTN